MVKKKRLEKRKKKRNQLSLPHPIIPPRSPFLIQNFSGADIQPKRDVGRFVRWPKYVRLQRQKSVLLKRLKVPPAINQFTQTVDKNTATELFRLMNKYRPESCAEKKARIKSSAEAKADGDKTDKGPKPLKVKYGINHITALVEAKKASLVVIAHDVDPIEVSSCLYSASL